MDPMFWHSLLARFGRTSLPVVHLGGAPSGSDGVRCGSSGIGGNPSGPSSHGPASPGEPGTDLRPGTEVLTEVVSVLRGLGGER